MVEWASTWHAKKSPVPNEVDEIMAFNLRLYQVVELNQFQLGSGRFYVSWSSPEALLVLNCAMLAA